MAKVFVRSAYNYDMNAASDESGLDCQAAGDGMTKQEPAEDADINVIVRRFGITGQLPVGVRMPSYQDFSGVFDFHSAANAIAAARESFDTMPAEVRARFQNDPARFVDFCSNRENLEEAKRLGLVPPSEVPDVGSGLAESDLLKGGGTPLREGAKAPADKGEKPGTVIT